MREHVVAASKAMRNGDWKKCRDLIINEKMNGKVKKQSVYFHFAILCRNSWIEMSAQDFGINAKSVDHILENENNKFKF